MERGEERMGDRILKMVGTGRRKEIFLSLVARLRVETILYFALSSNSGMFKSRVILFSLLTFTKRQVFLSSVKNKY